MSHPAIRCSVCGRAAGRSGRMIQLYEDVEPIHYQSNLLAIKIIEVRNNWELGLLRWHYHKELEFIFVKKGSVVFHTVDQSYRLHKGDVLLIGSNQLHANQRIDCEEAVYLVMHVKLQPYFEPAITPYYHYFSEHHRPLSELNVIFRQQDAVRRRVGQIMRHIFKEMQTQTDGFELAVSLHVKQILLSLYRNDTFRSDVRKGPDLYALQPVFQYIDQQLSDKIDMKEACKLLNMSYNYFSKHFKDVMGTPFIEYVNFRRIHMAERHLATKTASVNEVARMVGLENITHFYRLFQRYNGCTPKQYVARLKQRG
ncbi:AraC family transcriptional regulator [Paenibacillus mesophilus]|uniref:AraC family transcriptional regulator n=1 Tax=Paenibacillus mesophilus TaxID=2582849 RepID=UPI00110E2330|nr:AraC family transcriptional regulator [Paenibacillus mesophilus]TMV47371.1 AraC family transcriptional regulator [Paenibacillus mesophilus]